MMIRKILAPTDFSEASEPALLYAVDLAERLDARVTLLHAYGLPIHPILDGVVLPPPEALVDELVDVSQRLESARKRVQRASVPIDVRSIVGFPVEAIVDVARDEGYDLIVIGTHGRTGLRRFAMGSVAERVVRISTVPVLAVRSATKDDAWSMRNPPLL